MTKHISDTHSRLQDIAGEKYSPSSLEQKWQTFWDRNKIFSPSISFSPKPWYNLMMFPYPSAEGMHVGNMYAFTGADIYGRFNRMQGYDVLEPIGLDGFGIHSENYALKIGVHPMEQAQLSESNFYRQLHEIGNSYDWTRTIETYKPSYYKWTQWIFVQMFKAGLAYRKTAEVNWCQSCKTVLSDEQAVNKLKIKNEKLKNYEEVKVCERCGTVVEKKNLEQWFLRITQYAERLLSNLDKLDWTEKVKIAQKQWIGRSQGCLITFKLDKKDCEISVFTTRPDTLCGATFLVVAPEHQIVNDLLKDRDIDPSNQLDRIKKYIEESKSKTDQERTAEGKDKTGVFTGLYAINPATKEKIPVWIADYVLSSYGTGAIMAVPAHDSRDFEFAHKFNLPIKQVIAPYTVMTGGDAPREDKDIVKFDASTAIVRHWKDKNKFYVVKFSTGQKGLPGGHVDPGETIEEAIRHEVLEETGYKNIGDIKILFEHAFSRGFKSRKQREEECHEAIFVVDLRDSEHVETNDKEVKEGFWMTKEEIYNDPDFFNHHRFYLEYFLENKAYTGEGRIVNSANWNSIQVPQDISNIIKDIEKNGWGKATTHYHLRDWLISRQRYWGAPIPMIYCPSCAQKGKSWLTTKESLEFKVQNSKLIHNSELLNLNSSMAGWYPVANDKLPVALPYIKDYKPLGIRSTGSSEAGNGPLANHPEFYKTVCPECNGSARRETDVSDTFLDSAWYFLRYPSTHMENVAFDKEITKKWLPVNMYIGGAEHSVLHLLYSRFVTMVLHDLKLVDFEEPFSTFFAHGLIIKDGAKMSKSKGNVVVPDEYITKYGADALRCYLMFLGPFSNGGDFRDTGMEGMHKFIKRVWTLFIKIQNSKLKTQNDSEDALQMMHKTIKSVTEDISNFSYNTAIARLMEWYNFLSKEIKDEKSKIKNMNSNSGELGITKQEIEVFLKLLAPFAPHITEELWSRIQNSEYKIQNSIQTSLLNKSKTPITPKYVQNNKYQSIHLSSWPKFDEKYLAYDYVVIPIQVNGKRRGEIRIQNSEFSIEHLVEKKAKDAVSKYFEGKKIKKVIYVPGKIINFVV